MNKAYKFRIYPTVEQKIMFDKTFGCVSSIITCSVQCTNESEEGI